MIPLGSEDDWPRSPLFNRETGGEMSEKPKPMMAWAVVLPNGHIMPEFIRQRRSDAIECIEYDHHGELWRNIRKEGYRVEKVWIEKFGL